MSFHVFDVAFVLAETVNNEWFSSSSELLYDIFEIGIGENRHNWSENFLLHKFTILFGLLNNSGRKVHSFFNNFSSVND